MEQRWVDGDDPHWTTLAFPVDRDGPNESGDELLPVEAWWRNLDDRARSAVRRRDPLTPMAPWLIHSLAEFNVSADDAPVPEDIVAPFQIMPPDVCEFVARQPQTIDVYAGVDGHRDRP